MPDLTLPQAISALGALPPQRFWVECFSRYASSRSLSLGAMLTLGGQAAQCGERYAQTLLETSRDPVEDLCAALGLKLREFTMPPSPSMEVFALFETPNTVYLRSELLKNAGEALEKQGIFDILGEFDLREVILAHELFHFLEYRDADTIFTRTHREAVGRFRRKRELAALGEIAAMHFAAKLCGLPWSPFLLDCVMMSVTDVPSALAIAHRILDTKEGT